VIDHIPELSKSEWETHRVVSADLTAASDLIPFDLVNVLWEELEDAYKFPRWA
jgi:hypothetical protein